MTWLYNLLADPVERLLYCTWRKQLWDTVQGPEVLELSAGTRKNSPYYPPGVDVTVAALSSAMLSQTRRWSWQQVNKCVVAREKDVLQIDFPDCMFDEVVGTFVFCSVLDPVVGLREALRVTKQGGRLLLLDPVRADNTHLAGLMERLDPLFHRLIGVHIARRSVSNVVTAGWAIDRVMSLKPSGIYRIIEAHKP